MKSSLAKKAVFWSYFMFVKVRNYPAPNFTTEDFRIQVRGALANYAYGCHVTPVTHGAWGPWISILPERHHSRTPCSQVCTKESHRPVLQDRVSGCTLARCKHPDCFPIVHVRKVYFGALFLMFWCPCYALDVMSNR